MNRKSKTMRLQTSSSSLCWLNAAPARGGPKQKDCLEKAAPFFKIKLLQNEKQKKGRTEVSKNPSVAGNVATHSSNRFLAILNWYCDSNNSYDHSSMAT